MFHLTFDFLVVLQGFFPAVFAIIWSRYSIFLWIAGWVLSLHLLILKSELMPRSPSMPRSQPMPSYLLYSSLVFCCSQVPISITAKHLTQPWFPSLPCSAETLTISTSQVIVPRVVTRQPRSIFRPQVSWWPEVKYIGRVVLHQHFPIQSLYFLLIHSCFNTPDPHHPHSTWP